FFTLVPKKQNVLTAVGRTTMVVYLLHMAVVRWFHEDPFKQYLHETSHYWILFVMSLLIVYFLSRRPAVQFINLFLLIITSLNFHLRPGAGLSLHGKTPAEQLNRSEGGIGGLEPGCF